MVKCEDCGWVGKLEECNWFQEQEETIPHCPKCDGTDLIDLNQDMVLV